MKIGHRLSALLLCMSMILTMLPTVAFAETVNGAGESDQGAPVSNTDYIIQYRRRTKIYEESREELPAPWILYDSKSGSEHLNIRSAIADPFSSEDQSAMASACKHKTEYVYKYYYKPYGTIQQNTYWYGTEEEFQDVKDGDWIHWVSDGYLYTRYTYCTSINYYTDYYYYMWSEWTEWGEIVYTPDADTEVETRKVNKVKYNANGGSGAPESQYKIVGEDLTLSSNIPLRDDYVFLGWATTSTGAAEYSVCATYSANANITLYAVWKPVQECEDIKTYYRYREKTYTTSTDELDDPWILYDSEIEYLHTDFEYKRATNLSGYCVHEKIQLYRYVNIYNGNEIYLTAEEANSTPEIYLGTLVSRPNGYTYYRYKYCTSKTPYTLYYYYSWGGWSEWSEAPVVVPGGADVETYSVELFTIGYDANGGNGAPVSQTKTSAVGLKLSDAIPTRESYIFLGWATSAEGKVVYAPGDEYSANADTTLYAVWQFYTEYTVTYDANGGLAAPAQQIKIYGESITLSADVPTRENHQFLGWATSADGEVKYTSGEEYSVNADVTLYAVWKNITEYSITYDANGGVGAPSKQCKIYDESIILSAEIPTRENYQFLGWATSRDGAVKYAPGTEYVSNADITLYAVWHCHSYDNDCDIDCNECGESRDITHIYGAWITTKQPTCTMVGSKYKECTVCGSTVIEGIAATGEHTYVAKVTEPTCTEQGYTTHKCSVCGDDYVDTFVAANGHAYTILVIKPTCTAQGYTTHQCSVCSHNYIDSYVQATGHKYDGDCDTSCNVCDAKREITHIYGTWVSVDIDTHKRVCQCGDTQSAAHNWDDGVITIKPTETTFGEKTYTCNDCLTTKTEKLEKTSLITSGTCGRNLTWSLYSNGELIIEGTGDMYDYRYYNNKCTSPWNSWKADIKAVVIEDGVTSIGAYAFYWYHENLARVEIAGTVSVIGEYAFYRCYSLTDLTIADGLTEIGKSAFQQCYFATLTIPNSVTSIGYNAFNGCSKLTDVSLGKGIELIDYYAFSNCYRMKNVWCSGSVTDYSDSVLNLSLNDSLSTANWYYENCLGVYQEQTHIYSGWKNHNATQHKNTCECGDAIFADHSWDDGVVTEKPTHLTTGVMMHTCSVCNAEKTVDIAKQKHEFGEWTTISDTQHSRICECGTVETESHNWDNGVIVLNPTFTVYGKRLFTCEDCSATKIEPIYTYVITFDVNGGQNAPIDQFKIQGKDYTIPNTIPVREGYIFKCWTTNTAGEAQMSLPVSELEGLHYAVGPYEEYTVSCPGAKSISLTFDTRTEFDGDYLYIYDCFGNIFARYTRKQLAGVTITVPGDSIKLARQTEYYTDWGFAVTSAIAEFETFSAGDIYITDENMTLYAVWEACEHSWNSGEVVVEPTHTSYGECTYVCKICSETKVEQIAKTTEHAYSSWVKLNAETHQRACECGDVEIRAHNWDDGEITTQSTHTTFGVRTHTCADCTATKTEQVAKTLDHSYGLWTNIDAENHKRICACGDVETKTHSWNDGVITTQPTHTTFGVRTYTCNDCSATKTEQVAKTTEHAYGFWTKVDAKNHQRTCACGDVVTKAHNWDAGEITTQPTHTTFGVRTYTCKDCSATKTEQVAKTPEHSYGVWTKLDVENHQRTCACGDVETETHNWDTGVITTQPTHTVFGVRTYTCGDCSATKTEQVAKTTDHAHGSWTKVDDETHKRICACGDVVTDAHNWNSGEITTQPTHTTFGERTYTCKDCSASKTEQVAKIPEHSYSTWTKVDSENHQKTCACGDVVTKAHNWNDGVITTQPTHTTFGVRTYTCKDCAATKTEQVDKTPDHSYGEWMEVDADTHNRICACGKVETETHEWDDGVIAVAPTQTSEGEMVFTCLDCGATRIEIIPMLPEYYIGDANGDGVVDTLDRMILSRYLANWDDYTADDVMIIAVDLNKDGVVDTLDRMILNRHLANWEGYEDILKVTA